MNAFSRSAILASAVALGLGVCGQVRAAEVQAGVLTCNVSSGWGFIIGSSRDLRCVYSPASRPPEHYNGSISKFGVDIGYLQSAVIVWAVAAPTANIMPGSLAGTYGGVTGSATAGAGAGANVLVGGSANTITLQPVSIEGSTGLNVAAGIAAITLTPAL